MTPDRERGGLPMTFWDHLAELRVRLLRSVIGLAVGFGVAYAFSEKIFRVLMIPFNQAYGQVFHREPKLIYTGLLEPFVVYLKTGLVGGLFLASPFVFYQVWRFVAPGLKPNERKHGLRFVVSASVMFIGGALFGYFAVFPVGFRYFLEIAPSAYVEPMIRMADYYRLASWTMIVFGLVFEAPLFVLYLVYVGLIKARHLTKNWRAIVVCLAIAAAILTPPDPGSMILMGIPMLVLYGVTIVLALAIERRPKNTKS